MIMGCKNNMVKVKIIIIMRPISILTDDVQDGGLQDEDGDVQDDDEDELPAGALG